MSDHSATEARLFRTRVNLLDVLRSKSEWDLEHIYEKQRSVCLCFFTCGLFWPCVRRKRDKQYPGRLSWRADHPRPDWWVSPSLAPVDDPAENILPLDEYLRLDTPVMRSSPEAETIHRLLRAGLSHSEGLKQYIDSTYLDLWNRYRQSPKSPQDLAAFESRKRFLSAERSRIEWKEWHLERHICCYLTLLFTAFLTLPCFIMVACEKYPGFEAWRSMNPEPAHWRT